MLWILLETSSAVHSVLFLNWCLNRWIFNFLFVIESLTAVLAVYWDANRTQISPRHPNFADIGKSIFFAFMRTEKLFKTRWQNSYRVCKEWDLRLLHFKNSICCSGCKKRTYTKLFYRNCFKVWYLSQFVSRGPLY